MHYACWPLAESRLWTSGAQERPRPPSHGSALACSAGRLPATRPGPLRGTLTCGITMAPGKVERVRAGQPACIRCVSWSHFLTTRCLAFQPGHRGGPEPEGRVSLPRKNLFSHAPQATHRCHASRADVRQAGTQSSTPPPALPEGPRFPSSVTATQSQSQRPGMSELRWCDLLHTTWFPGHSHREREHLPGVLAARSPLYKLPHGFWGWEMWTLKRETSILMH